MGFRAFRRLSSAYDHVADWAEQFTKNSAFLAFFLPNTDLGFLTKLITGRYVEVVFNNVNAVTVPHGLGRAYTGGLLLWKSDTVSYKVSMLGPLQFQLEGGDPTINARFGNAPDPAPGPPNDNWTGTIGMWIF